MTSRLRVVTIATDLRNNFLLNFLLPSCISNKIHLTVLQPSRSQAWKGFSSKKIIISSYLERLYSDNEIIFFTDGYDTLILQNQENILDKYYRFDSPVVFSGEYNCWPLGMVGQILYGEYDGARFPYLNGGGYIGRVGDLKHLLNKYNRPPVDKFPLLHSLEKHGHNFEQRFNWSDQFFWTLVYLLEKNVIKLDRDGKLFNFYGPIFPCVDVEYIVEKEKEFKKRGKRSSLYKKEFKRLRDRLSEENDAAQIHFAGAVTKSVFNEMYKSDLLPAWITDHLGSYKASLLPRRIKDYLGFGIKSDYLTIVKL